MTWQIREMPLSGPLFEQAIEVYGEAFLRPPYRDPGRGRDVRERIRTVHQYRPGFHALVAVEDGAVIGMGYVHRSLPGQWWHDTVAAAIGPEEAGRWLRDAVELVEIAVSPRRQGEGIGTALIAALVGQRRERTCVLSTRADSEAHRLYERLGFRIISRMTFAPGGAPFFIMGRCLREGPPPGA